MPVNLWADGDFERPVARCAYCYEPKNGKKFTKRHFTNEDFVVHVEVCNSRCGDLWQEQIRREFGAMNEFAHSSF